MPDTTFVSEQTKITTAWAQDVNDTIYKALGAAKTAALALVALGIGVGVANANDLTAGNLTVQKALSVTGVATLQSRVVANGVTDDGTTGIQGTSGKLSGNLSIGGTLNVTGASALAGLSVTSLTNSGNSTVTGTLTANGQINSTATLVSGTYQIRALGAAGAARSILIAGMSGYSNGLIVDYNGTNMIYQMLNGRVLVNGAADDGSTTFQVAGSAVVSGILKARDPSHTLSTTGFSTYVSLTDSANSVAANIGYTSPSNFDFSIYHGLNGNLLLYTNAAERMRIAATGQVLIGTTTNNGTDVLQVNGTIYSAGNIAISTTGPAGGLVLKGAGIMYNSDVWGPVAVYQGGTFVGRSYWVGQTNGSPGFVVDTRFTPNALLLIDKGSANTAALLINGAINNGADTLQVNGSIIGTTITAKNSIVPAVDNNTQYVGLSAQRWTAIYAVNGTIQTSDKRLKTGVAPSLGLDFVNQLNPVSYRWRDHDNGIHQGLIAQEVDALLDRLGVKSFAGLSKPDEGYLGLNYSEFIAPLIRAVQELSNRVKQLEKGAA